MEKFSKISESQITKAIINDFCEKMNRFAKTDVVIVGGGPSGLVAARDLAKDGIETLIIESNNYLGGGFWIGGYLMNGVTVRAPAQEVFDEIGVPYKEVEKGLYITDGPNACAKLISAAYDAGAVAINMTKFDDAVLRENNKISGVVINWMPIDFLPRAISCLDPVSIESKIVIDATGHDASVVKSLERRGILKTMGFGAMWVEKSEDLLVAKTSEVHPGLIVAGMAVSTMFGIPRMGPTFGGMLLSGKKAAKLAKAALEKTWSLPVK
ncbi:MAG: sulfide-dependent adenosine diphosphate thiazole synthase [Candidatus Omnitrophota bacterium]